MCKTLQQQQNRNFRSYHLSLESTNLFQCEKNFRKSVYTHRDKRCHYIKCKVSISLLRSIIMKRKFVCNKILKYFQYHHH